MIYVYVSPHNRYLEAAQQLKAGGLVQGADWCFKPEHCFRSVDLSVSAVYTENPQIVHEYKHNNIEVIEINAI